MTFGDDDHGEPKVAFVLQAMGVEFSSYKDLYREGATHWFAPANVPGDVVVTFGAGTGVIWMPESFGEYKATNRTARQVFHAWCADERQRRQRAKCKT